MSSAEETDTMSASSSGDEMEIEATSPVEKRILHSAKLPTKERIMKDVPMPIDKVLQKADALNDKGLPIPDIIRKHLQQEGKLSKELLLEIISLGTQVLVQEPNVLAVKEPVTSNYNFIRKLNLLNLSCFKNLTKSIIRSYKYTHK
jgi:hypothetical protein